MADLREQMVEALFAKQTELKVQALRTETIVDVCAYVAERRQEVLVRVLENTETQHITFGTLDSDEILHPDWCRECRVEALKELLRTVKGFIPNPCGERDTLFDQIEQATKGDT